ncbi:uncharacterized protein LOC117122727 [Anneissia japonica]|uniref:uncharacterized protein LOC117122727 n=1 Tax=Anneissia japonica TaxID=1529436 RepID=UPI001425A688|nr:uncharacterized protein LOC117122727 [Anneissia japonica]
MIAMKTKSISLRTFMFMAFTMLLVPSESTTSQFYPNGNLLIIRHDDNSITPNSWIAGSEANGACPFEMKLDFNQSRIPANIWRAEKKYRFCRDVTSGAETNQLCQPFSIPMQVMWRNGTQINHRYHYRIENESVRVAFLCN